MSMFDGQTAPLAGIIREAMVGAVRELADDAEFRAKLFPVKQSWLAGWKTLLFNVGCSVLVAVDWLTGAELLIGRVLTEPRDYALAMIALNLANVILRRLTTGPMAGAK